MRLPRYHPRVVAALADRPSPSIQPLLTAVSLSLLLHGGLIAWTVATPVRSTAPLAPAGEVERIILFESDSLAPPPEPIRPPADLTPPAEPTTPALAAVQPPPPPPPTPPPEPEELILGIDDGDERSASWIGYRDFLAHFAPLAQTEQAARRLDAAGDEGRAIEPVPPGLPTPSPVPAQAAAPRIPAVPEAAAAASPPPTKSIPESDGPTSPEARPLEVPLPKSATDPNATLAPESPAAAPAPPQAQPDVPPPSVPATDPTVRPAEPTAIPSPVATPASPGLPPGPPVEPAGPPAPPSALPASPGPEPGPQPAAPQPSAPPEAGPQPIPASAPPALPPVEGAAEGTAPPSTEPPVEPSQQQPDETAPKPDRGAETPPTPPVPSEPRPPVPPQPIVAPGASSPASASTPGPRGKDSVGDGEISDSESDATSVVSVPPSVWKNGRPIAAKGLTIKTRKPRFTILTLVTTNPRNPVVEVKFDREGKPAGYRLVVRSGFDDIDGPILDAVAAWRAAGKELEKLGPRDAVTVRIKLLLSQ